MPFGSVKVPRASKTSGPPGDAAGGAPWTGRAQAEVSRRRDHATSVANGGTTGVAGATRRSIRRTPVDKDVARTFKTLLLFLEARL
jgi:hypothetical protein